jgi:prevent-host-death family protein
MFDARNHARLHFNMKTSADILESPTSEPEMFLQEISQMPGIGATISIRSAKTHLSALLDFVAKGREVTITSGGKPKAVLFAASHKKRGKPFTGTREHLAKMPPWQGGPTAEEIIREDRDSRGW